MVVSDRWFCRGRGALVAAWCATVIATCSVVAWPVGPVAFATQGISYPTNIYLPPVPPISKTAIGWPEGAKVSCPNPAGVRAPSEEPTDQVIASLNALFSAPTEAAAFAFSDRAGWVWVSSWWGPGRRRGPLVYAPGTVEVLPAAETAYVAPYRVVCGKKLVRESYAVVACEHPHELIKVCEVHNPAMVFDLFFFDRRGYWLFWGEQP